MDLEKLELVFDFNLDKIQVAADKVKPYVDKMVGTIEKRTKSGSDSIEKNMDITKDISKMTKAIEEMSVKISKQMSSIESSAEKGATGMSRGLSKGFRRAKVESGTEVDAIMKNIDSKMKQARAAQEKLAYLRTQKSSVRSARNPEAQIRYDEQILRAEVAVGRFQGQAQKMAQSLQNEFKVIPQELSNITKAMAENESKIERMRNRIKSLNETYNSQKMPTGSFTDGWKQTDTKASLETQEKLSKQSEAMNKAIKKNDALTQAYANLEDRLKSVTPAVHNLNTELGDPKGYNASGNGIKKVGAFFTNSKIKIGAFFDRFKRGNREMQRSGPKMVTPLHGMNKMLGSFTRRLLIAGLAYKAFSGAASYMGQAVRTNQRFADSLNAVKVNLATAFNPIYEAIMPALIIFIEWLAKATAYLASFIATLFGTTFSAAKKSAEALNNNINDMNDTGSAADKNAKKIKKMQNALMGFDEINTLSFGDDPKDDKLPKNKGPQGNGLNFNIPDPKIPEWVNTFADKVKNILKRLFDPMKAAWNNQGQRVIDAWKYALGEVGGLIGAIGRSFMEVWENGTGQRFIENLLILLADVLYIIGDIAGAFRRAWEDNGRGTALIQSIFNLWNGILELLHEIAESFRETWNDGTGERIAGHILEIFTNINNTVGSLADCFKEVWTEGNTGTEIFKIILGTIEHILGNINDMSAATKEWADNLNLSPALNGIKNLFKSMSPIIKKVGDLFSFIYREGLLPIAKWALESAFPAVLDVISAAFDVLNSVIEALQPTAKLLWDTFLAPIAKWTGGAFVKALELIASGLRGVSDFIDKHQVGFSNFVVGFATFFGVLKGIMAIKTVIGVVSGIFTALSAAGGIAGLFSTLGGAIGTVVAFLGGPITLAVAGAVAAGVLLWKNWDTVKEKAGQLGKWVGEKWDGIKEGTKNAWGKVKDYVSGGSDEAKKNAEKNFGELEINSSSVFGNVFTEAKENWPKISKQISDKANEAKVNATDKFNELKNNASNRFEDIRSAASDKFNKTKDTITSNTRNAWNTASGHFNNLKNNAKDRFEDIRNNAKSRFEEVRTDITSKSNLAKDNAISAYRNMRNNMNTFMGHIKTNSQEGFEKVTGWAAGLGEKIAEGLTGGVDAIKKAAKKMAQGLVDVLGKGVNGTIGGVNWVLDKVGSDMELAEWKVPKYGRGTLNHPGGPAIVNDAPGSTFREAYELPDGSRGIFPNQKNLMVDLPKNAKVLNARSTAQQYNVPKYAGGVGRWMKDKWETGKKFVGDVWDLANDPEKLVKKAIGQFTNLKDALEPGFSIAQGAISKASTGAIDMVKNALSFGGDASGNDEGYNGSANFGGLRRTSGFGSRIHPVTGQRSFHGGVDFAGGQGIGHPIHAQQPGNVTHAGPTGGSYGTMVKAARGAYEYIYAHLSKALVKKGDNISAGQKIGLMGNTGRSTGPHLHYEVRKNGKAVDPFASIQSSGSVFGNPSEKTNSLFRPNVAKWEPTIKQALSRNGLPTNATYTNAWLRQVQTESGGNEKAIQGNIGDINNRTGDLAKGLLQTISATFNAYKHNGHGNVFKGLDNSLAAINYAKRRYGAENMLNVIGRGRGYANGGLIKKEHMAMVGEGNKPELVVPLTKPARALELMGQALDYMGMDLGSLSMPEVFDTPYEDISINNVNSSNQRGFEAPNPISDKISTEIKNLITEVSGDSNPQDANVILQINETEIGRVIIKAINKITKQTGTSQIIL